MKYKLQIGDLYGNENKNEIYVYLGNNTIYCYRSPAQKHVGHCYEDRGYEEWLQTNFYKLG